MRTSVRVSCIAIFLSGVLCVVTVRGDTAETSTSDIIEAGLDVACVDYQVVGGCVWMTCTNVGCSFDYSVRVSHRIPEAVVTAYPLLGQNPWPDATDSVTPTAFAADGGATDEGGSQLRETALKFKNTEVFGSPATAVYHAAGTTGSAPICVPTTWPTVPYFISTRDYNWRDPLVETPWTLRYFFEGVRAGGSHFAGLYPRIGFVKQTHDYKASLVAAKRAGDIVKQDWQPHVYTPLDTWYTAMQGQWPPGDGDDYVWQQLVPSVMSCRVLPDIDDSATVDDPYKSRVNSVTGNAWQLWRTYSCCEQEGAVLIFSI